ncbi:hypothetical protein AB7M16_002722 [Bradyrhizobium sp. USDA 372]
MQISSEHITHRRTFNFRKETTYLTSMIPGVGNHMSKHLLSETSVPASHL